MLRMVGQISGRKLTAGDALVVEHESLIEATGDEPGEVLLFDLA